MTAIVVALLALSVIMHALGEWYRRKARSEYESWRREAVAYKAWQSAADAWRAESDARIAAAMAAASTAPITVHWGKSTLEYRPD